VSAIDCYGAEEGWAVFRGCEGEDPYPVAWFASKETALGFAEMIRAHTDDGDVQAVETAASFAAWNSYTPADVPGLRAALRKASS
jgi:hypothetical protein